METLIVIGLIALFLLAAFSLWLNLLATCAVFKTDDLERTQKVLQIILVWVLPVIASWLVLHLLLEHDPEAAPKSWITNESINEYVFQGLRIQGERLSRTSQVALEREVVESFTEPVSGASSVSGGGD